MDYPYIRAWGQMMGSTQGYIDEQVTRARDEEAPHDAIYSFGVRADPKQERGWAVFSDVTSPSTADAVRKIVSDRGWK